MEYIYYLTEINSIVFAFFSNKVSFTISISDEPLIHFMTKDELGPHVVYP